MQPEPLHFSRPFRHGNYCVLDALGQVVACGGEWLCQRVIAGLPVLVRQGDLFAPG